MSTCISKQLQSGWWVRHTISLLLILFIQCHLQPLRVVPSSIMSPNGQVICILNCIKLSISILIVPNLLQHLQIIDTCTRNPTILAHRTNLLPNCKTLWWCKCLLKSIRTHCDAGIHINATKQRQTHHSWCYGQTLLAIKSSFDTLFHPFIHYCSAVNLSSSRQYVERSEWLKNQALFNTCCGKMLSLYVIR